MSSVLRFVFSRFTLLNVLVADSPNVLVPGFVVAGCPALIFCRKRNNFASEVKEEKDKSECSPFGSVYVTRGSLADSLQIPMFSGGKSVLSFAKIAAAQQISTPAEARKEIFQDKNFPKQKKVC